ncbi:MAG: CPXCG motif-containing cysteine-rich protein [Pseudomonadota bacterium]
MILDTQVIDCPYCGEPMELAIEPIEGVQEYYEDCHVCCQPILIKITMNDLESQAALICSRADDI